MKKIFAAALLMVAVLIPGFAQLNPQAQLELDPTVRYGKLDNGLTYYIKHNAKPEKRAEFYIFTNVGAIQENEKQNGLAHFLEHMAFNGLKSLPGKEMFTYLEGIGAKFGENINASTGVEQTQYMLNNIPVVREGVIDTCLLILHDWSCAIENKDEEINNERPVIIEEWRTRNNADWRMMEKGLKYLFGDSKYATTNVIGTVEELKTFDPQSLRDFYKTWYRPDLQAIIVVGDVDVDSVEKKIKDRFSDIKMPENPQPKAVHKIPGNKEPIIGIVTDPEANGTGIQIMYKMDPMPNELNSTGLSFLQGMLKNLISQMLNERLADLSMSTNPPFNRAQTGFSSLCSTCDVFMGVVSTKDGEGVEGFNALMTELERAKRYGFTEAELERAKTNMLRAYQTNADKAESRYNSQFVKEYMSHFSDNYPYTTPAYDLEVAEGYLPLLQLEQINQVLPQILGDENIVVLVNAPEREGLSNPTEEELKEVFLSVKTAEIEAPEQEVSDVQLMDPSTIKPGRIVKEKAGRFGSKVWTLSNGVEVIFKHTEYSKDNVSMTISVDGGKSLVEDSDLMSICDDIWSVYNNYGGLSKFTASDMRKVMTGKLATANPFISSYSHGVSFGGSPKDIETAMQLMYLTYTDPRFVEEEMAPGISQIMSVLPNIEKQPSYRLQSELYKTAYDSPRRELISVEGMKKYDFKTLERVYRQLFSNVRGAKMYVVGNIDEETIKPLIEKYVASLPSARKGTEWIDRKDDIVYGDKVNHFETQMETPKVTVLELMTADIPYTFENLITVSALNYAMDLLYTKTIREEAGGTYGVGAKASLSKIPKERLILQISFDTKPEQYKQLIELTKAGLKSIAEEGIPAENFAKIIENFNKSIGESRISNGYWMSVLSNYYEENIDMDTDYEKVVKELTPEKISSMVREILKQNNEIEIVMLPEAE